MRTNALWWTLIGSEVDQFRQIYSPGDNLCPYYIIDRFGNVYSRFSGLFLKHSINEHGYHVVSLDTIDCKRIQRRVHRLVMTTFNYIPGCENLEVDHLNGIKSDNSLTNLEWVSGKINTHRALNMGLKKSWKGTNNPKSIINREIALEVANMAANGASDQEIMFKFPNVTFYMLQNIIQGNTWDIPQDIVDKIHLIRHPVIIDLNTKHKICKWYQDNPISTIYNNIYHGVKKDYIITCMNSLGIDINDSTYRICKRLYYKHQDDNITSIYNY